MITPNEKKDVSSSQAITLIKMWRILSPRQMITSMLSSSKMITPDVYGNIYHYINLSDNGVMLTPSQIMTLMCHLAR
jgi:hypothetical protein